MMINISEFLLYPSFYSLIITGIILVIVFILFLKTFKNLENFKLITLLCLIAITIGVHGILHALFETKQKPNLDLSSLL